MLKLSLPSLFLCWLLLGCSAGTGKPADETTPAAPTPMHASAPKTQGFYALSAPDLDGRVQALSQYSGKVALVVNVASECGYTPQYEGLQELYAELAPRGFVVLGWPSNDFGAQEPGSADEIRQFCTDRYQVTFPMFAKVVTKAGPDQSPVYDNLGRATGSLPNWNFCKYLIARDGTVLGFYPSKVTPEDGNLRQAIEAALEKQG